MKFQHAVWMFLAVFSGGMAVSQAWDLLSGSVTGELAMHVMTLVVFAAASVYFFGKYFKARNAQQNER